MAQRGCSMLKWDHWHIEPSSICTLKCPRCPRTEVPDSLLNRQLTLEFFQNQIGADTVQNIRKITFCGNDGDPIYCRELQEICQWLKQTNPDINLVIITNGSYKSLGWWQGLAKTLDHRDEIHWSIDGWDQHSNEQYRLNSDWNSIMSGIQSFRTANTQTYCVWATIAFRFNQDHLYHMQSLAQNMGMDLFQLTKSTKFGSHYPDTYGSHDPLCPDRADLISTTHRFQRTTTELSAKIRPGQHLKDIFWQRAQTLAQDQQYAGICLIGNKGVFLNSQGEFYPCCWTANRYPHNQNWHNMAQQRFNLWLRPFAEIISDEFWHGDFLEFQSIECKTKCTISRLKDREHVTEW